jgi:cobalt-zinc-cadmium efflux system membrane fusion protein
MKKILPGIKYLFQCSLIAALCALSACHAAGGDSDDHDTKTTPAAKQSDTVQITQKQMEVAGITLGGIEQKNLGSIVKATGTLVLPPSNQAVVSTIIAGTVKQILVSEGAYVKSGQVVAYIESPDFITMQQDYLTTKSSQVYLRQEYERQKLLNDQNAGTGKVYQLAKANFLSGQEKLQSMATALKQLHINRERLNQGTISPAAPLIAPLSGQVDHVYVTIGSPAEVNKPLLDVIDDHGIYADLDIFEKDISRVKVGQKVELALNGQSPQIVKGTIYALNSTFETANRVVVAHVRLTPDGTTHLIPGTYVSAAIQISNRTVPALPEDAVVSAEGKQFIFLLTGEKAAPSVGANGKTFNFKKVEVVTGETDMGYTAVKLLAGLPGDAKVATSGAKYILAESQKSPAGESGDDDD